MLNVLWLAGRRWWLLLGNRGGMWPPSGLFVLEWCWAHKSHGPRASLLVLQGGAFRGIVKCVSPHRLITPWAFPCSLAGLDIELKGGNPNPGSEGLCSFLIMEALAFLCSQGQGYHSIKRNLFEAVILSKIFRVSSYSVRY